MSEMTLDKAMRERRSVRHFDEADVGDEVLREIFEQASWAPSPGNTQLWKVAALGPEVSRDVIRRFELAGWESVFPVLRQVLQNSSRSHDPKEGHDWNGRVLKAYHDYFEVRGSPRLVFIYRARNLRRYVNLFLLSLSMLFRRAKAKKTWAGKLFHVVSSLLNVPRLIRVNALTRTVGLANFTYAVALAAHARGLATCIQSNYLNVQPRLRRYLGLGRDVDIVASVLIGREAENAVPAPEMFRTRRPVSVDWIRAFVAV